MAVLGWDDTYRSPTVNFTDKLIAGFRSSINNDQEIGKQQIRKLNTGLATQLSSASSATTPSLTPMQEIGTKEPG